MYVGGRGFDAESKGCVYSAVQVSLALQGVEFPDPKHKNKKHWVGPSSTVRHRGAPAPPSSPEVVGGTGRTVLTLLSHPTRTRSRPCRDGPAFPRPRNHRLDLLPSPTLHGPTRVRTSTRGQIQGRPLFSLLSSSRVSFPGSPGYFLRDSASSFCRLFLLLGQSSPLSFQAKSGAFTMKESLR